MAEYKVSQLTEATQANDNDEIEVVIDSDSTPKSRKMKRSTLIEGLATQANLNAHTANVSNPHNVTKAQVGLSAAENTSDSAKPISTATQAALDAKASTSSLNTHIADTTNPHAVTKSQVGLSNVPNTDATSRANHTGTQPITTVTGLQTALDAKAGTSHTHPASQITDFDTEVANNPTVVANTAKNSYPSADATKLAGIAPGATANSSDVTLLNRTNHTGTQAINTVSGLQTALDSKAATMHTHDDRYYTESELDTALALKADAADVPSTIVESVVAGTNVTIDATDPANPIISASGGGGGGGAVDSVNGQTGVVVLDQDDVLDGTTYKQYSTTEKTKLSGIETGATANDTDANLKNRANHTGTQTAATISDFAANVSANTEVAANTTARHSHANKALLDTYTQTEVNLADAVTKKHVHTNSTVLDATTASFTTDDETKLDGIATGATANDTDANLKNRANHTGAQAISTVTGLQTALDAKASTTHAHAASDVTSGVFNIARLATGTPDGTKFVRDDGTLATPAGGGGTTLPSQTGNAGKFLKTDGSALSWDTPAGGGGGSSPIKYRIDTIFEDAYSSASTPLQQRFNQGNNSGGSVPYANSSGLTLQLTGTGPFSWRRLSSFSRGVQLYEKNPVMSVSIGTGNVTPSTTARGYKRFYGMGNVTPTASALPLTNKHIGFVMEFTDSTTRIDTYSCSNGTTQSTGTFTKDSAFSSVNTSVSNGTTSIKYYHNGTLVGTLVSDLPTGYEDNPGMFGITGQNITTSSTTEAVYSYSVEWDLI